MAVYGNAQTQYQAGGVASRIINAFSGAINSVARYNEVRATRIALSRLSDRELEDIGLSRADIERVARS